MRNDEFASNEADTSNNDELGAQIGDYLDALSRDDCLRVDSILKESPWERTERVCFVGRNGSEQGPYIRKTIQNKSGLGTVYRSLYQARIDGERFRYLPAILECHEAGEQTVVLMEFARGQTLRELVQQTDPKNRRALCLSVFPALLRAVGELHHALDTPIIHRDLSPSNIMCPPDHPNRLTIIDFGIARTYKPGASCDTAYFGTRPYAPPEQYGFGQTDIRSDIYALGMVLFFMLTGRDPGPNDRANHWHDAAIDDSLRLVIDHACSINPEDRFADTEDFARTFKEYAGNAPLIKTDGPIESPRNGFILPHWLGRIWNFAVCLVLVFLLVSSVMAAFNPVESNADWPLWFRLYAYLGFFPIAIGLIAYQLFDKRRLSKRFTWVGTMSFGRGLAFRTGLFAANFVLLLLIGIPAVGVTS